MVIANSLYFVVVAAAGGVGVGLCVCLPLNKKKKKFTDVFLESVDARRVCTHMLQKQQMPGF